MSDKNIAQIRSINSLKDFYFFVADYQRGYKWGLEEVEFLLDDIFQFETATENFYCLQPIVLKNKNITNENEKIIANSYELIDGQQRLSTIFLILKCLNHNVYKLDYQTRDTSKTFIKDISALNTVELEIEYGKIDFDTIRKILQSKWKEHIVTNKEHNNIDNYHFFCAYHYIAQWISDCDDEELEILRTNLLENTKVIWYNVDNYDTMNSSAEEIFVNFNDGKIALVQAELIKALFVLDINKEHNLELRTFKLNQFADEWNSIEHQLQDDLFWFFVSNDVSDSKKYNRIDILFDLIKEKSRRTEDNLQSYHKYYEEFKTLEENERLDWNEVIDMFNIVKEWYEHRNTYHLIGYIVNENITSLNELVKIYKKKETKSKTAFEEKLRDLIREKYFKNKEEKIRKKYEYETIQYGDHSKQMHSILILFNIATYHFTDNSYRFPFELLKKEKGWSLEHIHAISTDNFDTNKDIKDWIADVKNLVKAYKNKLKENEKSEIKEAIKELVEKLNEDNKKVNNEQQTLVGNLANLIEAFYNKDALSNICLLDLKTNIILGKKYFKGKRKAINFFDTSTFEEIKIKHPTLKSKPYIPIATKQVFQKYFTQNQENLQMTYWGIEDRIYYVKSIETMINKFLIITD